MKKIFLLFIVFSCISVFSQINKLYNNNIQTITSDIEKLNNGNYIVPFNGLYLNGDKLLKLVIIDSIGNINKELLLELDNTVLEDAACKSLIVKDSLIYFLTKETYMPDTTKYFFALTCYNYNLDTIWNKKYFVDTTRVFANSICQTNDGGFAIAGNIDKGGLSWDAFILKVDSIGNEQWHKEYGYNYDEVILNITQTLDNGFIIGGYSRKNSNQEDWYIVRTDSVGNKIWDWVLYNPYRYDQINDIIQTQDGNFVAVGSKYYDHNCGYTQCIFSNARLLKFDINKNILLDTLYYEKCEFGGYTSDPNPLFTFSNFVKIKQLNNGSFLVVNKKKIPTYITNEISNIYLLNNNFKLIKKLEYASIAWGVADEKIRDLVINNDGSLAIIGDISSDLNNPLPLPTQRVWFIKTDANYCDNFGSCDTIFNFECDIPDSISKLDTINLNYRILSNYNINYNAILFFLNKELDIVNSASLLNLIPNNTYNLSVNFNDLYVYGDGSYPITDTMYIMVKLVPSDSLSHALKVTYPSDNILYFYQPEVGIKEITKPQARINVYPNPAKNTLFLEIKNKDENKNKNKVFIYDIYGRVVKQFKIQNSKLKIQVEDLEKGVYFVKIGEYSTKFIKK